MGSLAVAAPVLERPTLVAVDGVDGSGNTTFAESLATAYTDLGRPILVHGHQVRRVWTGAVTRTKVRDWLQ